MSKKILVLDDDQDILDILYLILTEDGYEVRTLPYGDTVFANLNDFHPDLVLMDVMLGSMDGRSICKEMKANNVTCSVPVILISGTHDLAASLDLPGAPNYFIAKPFDLHHLLSTVEKYLAV